MAVAHIVINSWHGIYCELYEIAILQALLPLTPELLALRKWLESSLIPTPPPSFLSLAFFVQLKAWGMRPSGACQCIAISTVAR